MDFSKKLNLDSIWIFLFLVLFPFGQIIRIGILQPIDVIAALGAIYAIFKKYKKPDIFRYFSAFIFIAAFSWVFSVFVFKKPEVLYGLLYLFRFVAYSYFLIYVWNFSRRSLPNRRFLVGSLITISVVSALFGWIQYFAIPSIKPFTIWGWDDHLFRLVGTFLDPGFLGIVIVFGLLTSIFLFFETKERIYLGLSGFLLISLAFTYSRASYLALFGGLLVIFAQLKNLRYFAAIIVAFLILIFLLPTSGNTILRITREFSAIARIDNYKETLAIFGKSPIFGVGYDNLCLARVESLGFLNLQSHACSGSDASLMFILATTGVAGLTTFIWFLYNLLRLSAHYVLVKSLLTALLIHSLFANSFFYSWVLGYVMILISSYPLKLKAKMKA